MTWCSVNNRDTFTFYLYEVKLILNRERVHWAGHVVRMDKTRNTCKILICELHRRDDFGDRNTDVTTMSELISGK
jgi:hypothetical protein